MNSQSSHSLRNYGIDPITTKIDNYREIESIDTADICTQLQLKIDLRRLPRFETYRNSARPFSATLSELLKAKIAQDSQ